LKNKFLIKCKTNNAADAKIEETEGCLFEKQKLKGYLIAMESPLKTLCACLAADLQCKAGHPSCTK
jgi:hypothetical protein